PGVAGKDDQNTNGDFFVHITKTRMEQEGRSYTLFSGVVGNGLDEARQSPTQTASEDWSASSLQFCDDETEIFFGFPRQPNQEFWSVTRPWGKSSIQRNIYLPGDGLDNDGDGDIDEPGEEVDDPTESGLGDDQPWQMLDDFREFILSNPAGVSSLLMSGKTLEDVYEALKPIVTVRSRSPIYGPAFFSEDNDTLSRRFLAPNMLNPYTPLKLFLDSVQDKRQTSIATTLENPDSPQPKLEPLAFPNNIRYLYPLSLDDDRDWTIKQKGKEFFFDLNRNGRPDSDWDGDTETQKPDFWAGAWPLPELARDMDSSLLDDFLDAYEEYEAALYGRYPSLVPKESDRDWDGWMGDHGDFNADGERRYDPEWGVNEDPPGKANGSNDPMPGRDGEDDDNDGGADLQDREVQRARDNAAGDGVDNDGDGMVDEVGETYIVAFDDDEDGKYDEDGPELQFWANLLDCIDEPPLCDVPEKSEYDGIRSFLASHPYYRPFIYDASVAGGKMTEGMNPTLIDGFTLWTSRMVYDATFFDPTGSSGDSFTEEHPYGKTFFDEPGALTSIRGVEAIRINEVAAYPIIRLQLEENQGEPTDDWTRKPSANDTEYYEAQRTTTGGDLVHQWDFTHIPPGEYRVVLYQPPGGSDWFDISFGDKIEIQTLDRTADFDFGTGLSAAMKTADAEDQTVEVGSDCTLKVRVTLGEDESTPPEEPDETRVALDYMELIRWRKTKTEPS
ncbi:MAG TPA: hypothetical protein PKH07_11435, partial [bacterium]|nr:hypothetical protein [bacterium]